MCPFRYTTADTYDAKIAEITRGSYETAFELEVSSGRACDADPCTVDGTWLMYSVERFYTAPLVANLTCEGGALASFTTWNTYKQSSEYPASYKVLDDDGDASSRGTFDFAAHWRSTTVRVSDAPSSGSVYVENQFGSNTTKTSSC